MTDELQKLRASLRDDLVKIVEIEERIGERMAERPHPNGMAHLSLGSRSGQYVLHSSQTPRSDGLLQAVYRADSGQQYEITIRRLRDEEGG